MKSLGGPVYPLYIPLYAAKTTFPPTERGDL